MLAVRINFQKAIDINLCGVGGPGGAAHNPHEIWYKQIALESFLHVPLSAPQPSPQHRPLQYIAPHRTNTENFSTVQSKSFWSSELVRIIILLLVIGEVYCRIFKLQKNYLSNRKDMFALEIILHLLDFAFGFCCCFIYISALSNTLLHVIEQVRNISIEEKHREGYLCQTAIVTTLSCRAQVWPGSLCWSLPLLILVWSALVDKSHQKNN